MPAENDPIRRHHGGLLLTHAQCSRRAAVVAQQHHLVELHRQPQAGQGPLAVGRGPLEAGQGPLAVALQEHGQAHQLPRGITQLVPNSKAVLQLRGTL